MAYIVMAGGWAGAQRGHRYGALGRGTRSARRTFSFSRRWKNARMSRSCRAPSRRTIGSPRFRLARAPEAERGYVFGDFSAHADGERRALDRVEEKRRSGLGETRL